MFGKRRTEIGDAAADKTPPPPPLTPEQINRMRLELPPPMVPGETDADGAELETVPDEILAVGKLSFAEALAAREAAKNRPGSSRQERFERDALLQALSRRIFEAQQLPTCRVTENPPLHRLAAHDNLFAGRDARLRELAQIHPEIVFR